MTATSWKQTCSPISGKTFQFEWFQACVKLLELHPDWTQKKLAEVQRGRHLHLQHSFRPEMPPRRRRTPFKLLASPFPTS